MVAARELPVITYGTQNSIAVTQAITAGTIRRTYSFYGHKRLMAACMQGMTGIWHTLAPAAESRSHAQNCLEYALTYAHTTPVDSFTWIVAARSSFVLKDLSSINRYLAYAWQTGRNEQWVAALRVNLAEDTYAGLTEINLQRHRSDLSLMVMSRAGIGAIANRYWSDPEFRERISTVVETLPQEDQRRFVSSVRRAAGGPY